LTRRAMTPPRVAAIQRCGHWILSARNKVENEEKMKEKTCWKTSMVTRNNAQEAANMVKMERRMIEPGTLGSEGLRAQLSSRL